MRADVLGAILAGGLARRMGGGDKTLLRLGDRTILAHVAGRLRGQCGHLVVNANGDPSRFAAHGLPVIADDVPGCPGPLAGILAALDHAARRHPGVPYVLTVAADTPFVPGDLVARLAACRESEGADLACAASAGRRHPVVGLWPVSLRGALRRALTDEGERKVDRFAGRYRRAVATWPHEPVDPFFNANDPADLEAAERLLRLVRE